MATDEQVGAALLADIIENPDDDFPRLVYADWLTDQDTEQGRARAAFIRHQISRGKALWIDRGKDCVEAINGEEYQPQVLAYAKRFTQTVLTVPGCHNGIRVKRGFVETVRMPLADWLREGPKLAREHPIAADGLTLENVSPLYISAHLLPPRQRDENATAWLMPTDDGRAAWGYGPTHGEVPAAVWDLLDGQPHAFDSGRILKLYDGRDCDDKARRAMLDLQRAALEWARAVQCLHCSDTAVPWSKRTPFCIFCDAGTKNMLAAAMRAGMAHALRQNQRTLDAVRAALQGNGCPDCNGFGSVVGDGQTRACQRCTSYASSAMGGS